MNTDLFIMLEAQRLFKSVYDGLTKKGLIAVSYDHIHVTPEYFKEVVGEAEVTVTDCNGTPQLNATICNVKFIALVTKPKAKYEYKNGELCEVTQ